MKPKFEIGDRVIYKPCKLCGSVINSFRTTGICAVTFDEDGSSHHIHGNDLEFENPKTAFLTRLQELLATFDATIESGASGSEPSWIDIYFGKEHAMVFDSDNSNYGSASITAENVFDYDKD